MAYYDLNIVFKDAGAVDDIITEAIKLGFSRIALNHIVTGKLVEHEDLIKYRYGKLDENDDVVDTESKHNKKKEALLLLKSRGKQLDVLKRLTVVIKEENIAVLNGNNKILKNYDIIAVEPSNDKTLLQCVQSNEIDIITFDLCQKILYPIKVPVSKQALDRNIYFELSLKECLKDNVTRRNMISNAKKIIDSTRGKNILITSGASDKYMLRGPQDLIHLGKLFGITSSNCKKAVTTSSREVLFHGISRKTEKGVLKVIPLKEVENWMVPNNPVDVQESKMEISEKKKKRKRE